MATEPINTSEKAQASVVDHSSPGASGAGSSASMSPRCGAYKAAVAVDSAR